MDNDRLYRRQEVGRLPVILVHIGLCDSPPDSSLGDRPPEPEDELRWLWASDRGTGLLTGDGGLKASLGKHFQDFRAN